jgi:ferric-dicitrate binding protein FerR (iron transport regulator)
MIRTILISVRNWKGVMLGEVLTGKRLDAMTPDAAAAYFVTHRDDGLTKAEQKLLSSWLSAHESHARALNRAEAVWRCFDQAGNDEVLAQMRAHSRETRPRRWVRCCAASSRRRFCRYWRLKCRHFRR